MLNWFCNLNRSIRFLTKWSHFDSLLFHHFGTPRIWTLLLPGNACSRSWTVPAWTGNREKSWETCRERYRETCRETLKKIFCKALCDLQLRLMVQESKRDLQSQKPEPPQYVNFSFITICPYLSHGDNWTLDNVRDTDQERMKHDKTCCNCIMLSSLKSLSASCQVSTVPIHDV